MFLHVTQATYLSEYTLRLVFNTGAVKDVNLKDELHGPVFEPLRDLDAFKAVCVNPATRTIEWPTGADFAPEFLDEIGQDAPGSERAAGEPLPELAAARPFELATA